MVGYDIKLRNILNEKYVCIKCYFILNQPVRFVNCGHRVCRSCYMMQDCCPNCLTNGLSEIVNDETFENELKSLPIVCCLCDWTNALGFYQAHLDLCHTHITCSYCDQIFTSMNDMNNHKMFECKKNFVPCLLKYSGCDDNICHFEISVHYSSEKHQNGLRKILYQLHAQTDQFNQISKRSEQDNIQSSTISPVDQNIYLFTRLCMYHEISLDGINRLTEEKMRHINDQLYRIQMYHPKLELSSFGIKLSIPENGNS